jgi:hypothetical protein
MKYFRALVIIAFIIAFGTELSLAAGHYRHHLKSSNHRYSKATKQSCADGWSSFEKATYLDKIPSVLDQLALSFRDFLGQFGLKLKQPR